MKGLLVLLLAALIAIPGAAQACQVGSDEMLFAERPDAPAGTQAIRVRFVNSGRVYEAFLDEEPRVPFTRLFGVARLLNPVDSNWQVPDWFPVYASPSSCSHYFATPRDAEGYLVGRAWREGPLNQFEAAARYRGNWRLGSIPLPVPPPRLDEDPCTGQGTWAAPCKLVRQFVDCPRVVNDICLPLAYDRWWQHTGGNLVRVEPVDTGGPVLISIESSDAILATPIDRFKRHPVGGYVVFHETRCEDTTNCYINLGVMPQRRIERGIDRTEMSGVYVSAKTPGDLADALGKLRYCVQRWVEQCPVGRSVSLAELVRES